MTLTTATVTFNIATQTGSPHGRNRRAKAWASTTADNDVVMDSEGTQIRVGDGRAVMNADGTGSFTVWVPDEAANPASWQNYFYFSLPSAADGQHQTVRFGPYTVTEDTTLAALYEEQEVPPTYITQVTGQLDEIIATAQAEIVYATETMLLHLIDASQAANNAAESANLWLSINGTQGVALDTDGVPYFDEDLFETTPTVAIFVDTDGAPYYAHGV